MRFSQGRLGWGLAGITAPAGKGHLSGMFAQAVRAPGQQHADAALMLDQRRQDGGMSQGRYAVITGMGFWIQVEIRAHPPRWPVFTVRIQRIKPTGDPIAKQMGREGWIHAPKPSAGPKSNQAPFEDTP